MGRSGGDLGPVLVLDTATTRTTLALGSGDGQVLQAGSWPHERRQDFALLGHLEELLRAAGLQRLELRSIVVGLGPGGFTGLRVGLATAKTLAYGLRLPLAGVLTPVALLWAAGAAGVSEGAAAVLQPAGPNGRYLTRLRREGGTIEVAQGPLLLDPAAARDTLGDDTLVAVDLAPGDGVPAAAAALGVQALEGLGAALLALGMRRLAVGLGDDVAALVPAYVTLPRGLPAAAGAGTWSPDLR
ncbi:MAG: tRNA (adenosine(37)-N6)-threonylcarbamoyltransferase complex dimerization subunit type 1 TsaB [Candidatus Limnocylindrales bacterium]